PVVPGQPTQRYSFAWHKSAMGLAINKEITGRMSELPDKNYSTQVYASGTWGVTRILGNGVVRFRSLA
ncbi:MAG: phage capsid protein, partial [Cetobacterium sp.]